MERKYAPRLRLGSLLFNLIWVIGALWCASIFAWLIFMEKPRASISGKVIARDTRNAIPEAKITLRRMDVDERGGKRIFTTKTDSLGRFEFASLPVGEYEIEAEARVHKLPATPISLREGVHERLMLELEPGNPWLQLILPQRVFTTKEKVRIGVHGFITGDELNVVAYEINVIEMLSKGIRLERWLHPEWYGFQSGPLPEHSVFVKRIKSFSVRIRQRDAEGIFTQYIDVPVNEPGVYLVTFRSNSHVKRATILITDIGLVVKENSRQVLIYAADLTSGEPIANVTVDAYLQYRRKPISLGVTDENGLINAELISHGWAEVKLIARKGNQISMMSFYMDTSPAVSKYKVHIYTDRPVYRPGHHVYFKGVVRLLNGMDFAIPKPQDVDIEVRDARGHKIWTGKARTNSFGTFFGEFDLPREVATGAAELTASIDGEEHHCSIPVAAYRKPEFTVKATAMRRDYLPGETARVKVSARYYFGVPVRNANIRYSVYRTEAWHVNYDLEDESSYWQPVDERGSLIMRGEATTDENGRAVIAIKLPRTTDSKEDATEQAPDWRWIPTVWHYTVELAVEDIGGRFVERTATFYMHPSAVTITASPQAYVIHPNEPLRVKFAVRDLKGKPHKGVKVHIIYGRVIWRRLEHGWREELVSVNRASAIADSKGEAWLSIKLDAPGQWVIHATVYDNQGRKNADVAYVSVYGEGMREIPQYRYPKLELVPTKPTFEVGEMAEVLLNTSVKDGYVWLTLEAERVYRSWVLKLDSKSQLIRFRIEPRYIPGVWLCATLVRHKRMEECREKIRISRRQRVLHVEITPDKTIYGPRDKVTWTIRTTDADGTPVRAEVSLAVVDESVYAIRDEDPRNFIQAFYSPKEHLVSTHYSFPEYFMQAGKGSLQVVRKYFPDTAFWKPDIVTDERGIAQVTMTMPDTLTTWRATVKALTKATALGVAVSKLITRKPLLVRLETPRFLTQGDEVNIIAVVHNETDESQRAKVQLEARGLSVRGARQTEVTIAPRDAVRISWHVYAQRHGKATLTLYARTASGFNDAIQKALQILPFGVRWTVTQSGVLRSGTAMVRYSLPANVIRDAGRLRLFITPSPMSSTLKALEYLAKYPWGCTEQTMSSFLPDVMVWRIWKELGWEVSKRLQVELPYMVQHGLLKLYNYQHDDGGWGWCYYDDSHLWMTAYVLYGLWECKRAGFEVDEDVLSAGIGWLSDHLPTNRPWWKLSSDEAFGYYVLAVMGKKIKLRASNVMLTSYSNHSSQSRRYALIAMAFEHAKRSELANEALDKLLGEARESYDACHWGTVEDTAWALRALLLLRPESKLCDKVAHWLMMSRTGDHWVSTKQTAFTVAALIEYLKVRGWQPPKGILTVKLNGSKVAQVEITPAHARQPDITWVGELKQMRIGRNTLKLEYNGAGTPYYACALDYYTPADKLMRRLTGVGIVVTRQYEMVKYDKRGRERKVALFNGSACPRGAIIRATLTLRATKSHSYLLLEEPLPSGCEVLETGELSSWEWWDAGYWFADRDVRDDKIAFFINELPPGVHKITYEMRAEVSGKFRILPTYISSMYDPSITAYGTSRRLVIK